MARSMAASDSASSTGPQASPPMAQAPNPISETLGPVLPRSRYSIRFASPGATLAPSTKKRRAALCSRTALTCAPAHANLVGLGGQGLVEVARQHAHVPRIRISGLARLCVGVRRPEGDDDALARLGIRQHLEGREAPLPPQDRPETPSDTAHLRPHLRSETDVRHPRVHDLPPPAGLWATLLYASSRRALRGVPLRVRLPRAACPSVPRRRSRARSPCAARKGSPLRAPSTGARLLRGRRTTPSRSGASRPPARVSAPSGRRRRKSAFRSRCCG